MSGLQVNDPVARFLIAVAVVLAVCHLLGGLVGRLGQPRVVGEVIGGLVLGPSLLGAVWPDGQRWLFGPAVVTAIGMAAQLGLAAFMFLLGCDLRTEMAGSRTRAVVGVVVGGSVLPFIGGLGVALASGGVLAGAAPLGSALFVGLALAITAVPVLARMLIELGLDGSRVGTVSLAAAAIGDGAAWILLALILAATGAGSGLAAVVAGGAAAGFGLFTVLCARPLVAWAVARIGPGRDRVAVPMLVAVAVGYAATSQLVGLHVVVGAFLIGAVMPRDAALIAQLNEQLRGFALTVLLPLFFVGVGLTTSVGLVGATAVHFGVFALILVTAITTKLVGAGVGARLAGLSTWDSARVGVLMNCRGVTELVVASIGYHAQLINQFGFTVLVLTALVTTLTTAPLIRAIGSRESSPISVAG